MFKISNIILIVISLSLAASQVTPDLTNQSPFYQSIKSNFGLNIFDFSGQWSLNSTTCSDLVGCVPNATFVTNSNNQTILSVIFPNISNCANYSGITVNDTITTNLGLFEDTNTTSPIFMWIGQLFVNNMTLVVFRNDTKANNVCLDYWVGPNSIVTNVTNPQTAYVNDWAGVWNIQKVISINDNQNYCVPDYPIFINPAVANTSAIFAWHLSSCPECGVLNNSLIVRNLTVSAGGARDQEDFLSFYLVASDTLVTVADSQFAALWIKSPQLSCVQFQNIMPVNSSVNGAQPVNNTPPPTNNTPPPTNSTNTTTTPPPTNSTNTTTTPPPANTTNTTNSTNSTNSTVPVNSATAVPVNSTQTNGTFPVSGNVNSTNGTVPINGTVPANGTVTITSNTTIANSTDANGGH